LTGGWGRPLAAGNVGSGASFTVFTEGGGEAGAAVSVLLLWAEAIEINNKKKYFIN
jgi:hypothetical protein